MTAIRWSLQAADDLESIRAFIARNRTITRGSSCSGSS
ncbi:Hypothetical protein A7982_11367 [Minicystis rosea]|nr:Hypothetical protein A7982_11367 [Minicystis rosea]